MTTTAEKLQIIIDSKAAIKQAILDKGGEVGDFTTYASAIANLPSGGDANPTAEKNAVTFYDYDGTIRYSYTAEEFLALTEMPPLPTQKGLICQEWNWSHEDAVEYVSEYGVLDVGATYITDDGKTRLYIRIAAEGRMDVPLYFSQTVANGVTIDWGDGSPTETLDGTGKVNTTHRYASIGDYCIKLEVTVGILSLGHDTNGYCVLGSYGNNGIVYCSMLQKVEIGNSVTSISGRAFQYCYSLSSITIPIGIKYIGTYAFYNCTSLSSIVISTGVTSTGTGIFQYCYSLSSIVIPIGIKSIETYAFYSCTSLSSIVIPTGVTSIGIGIFQSCTSLSSIVIPIGIKSIGNNAIYSCLSLSSIVIPTSVTSIGNSVFLNCYGMAYYDFSHHTAVPTLANTNAFTGIPSDCKIIVPDNLYDTWVAATNWSTYAANIIKKTDWDNQQ